MPSCYYTLNGFRTGGNSDEFLPAIHVFQMAVSRDTIAL